MTGGFNQHPEIAFPCLKRQGLSQATYPDPTLGQHIKIFSWRWIRTQEAKSLIRVSLIPGAAEKSKGAHEAQLEARKRQTAKLSKNFMEIEPE